MSERGDDLRRVIAGIWRVYRAKGEEMLIAAQLYVRAAGTQADGAEYTSALAAIGGISLLVSSRRATVANVGAITIDVDPDMVVDRLEVLTLNGKAVGVMELPKSIGKAVGVAKLDVDPRMLSFEIDADQLFVGPMIERPAAPAQAEGSET